MISINIIGGFGNQLFQIFASMAYSIKYNTPVIYPYNNEMGYRHYYWDTFFQDILGYTTKENQITESDINQFLTFKELDFTFHSLPIFDVSTLLLGFYQSYKYFQDVQTIIYNKIRLQEKKDAVQQKYPELFIESPKETVGIHFRLGDYKAKRYYHPIMNYEYFEKSFDYILNKRSNISRVLFVCESEDNTYVTSKIELLQKKYPEIEYIKVPDSIPDYEQVLILSLTNHNIISNSTFSWWGAYFNESPEKIVCYPSVWFGEYFEHTHDLHDLIPSDWIKIESNPIPWDQPLI
jgi:hypothetical protein